MGMRMPRAPIWTPEADERRFLVGLPVTLILILFLWKRGLLGSLGPYPILASFAFWCITYSIRFWKRLQNRGDLKRVILASAAFFALLLSVTLY